MSDNAPLTGKTINITINDISYEKPQMIGSQAILNVKLTKGHYNAIFSYMGDKNTSSYQKTTIGTVKILVQTKIYCADKNINHRQGLKNTFIVRLVDGNGKALKGQNVTFKVNSKSYCKN